MYLEEVFDVISQLVDVILGGASLSSSLLALFRLASLLFSLSIYQRGFRGLDIKMLIDLFNILCVGENSTFACPLFLMAAMSFLMSDKSFCMSLSLLCSLF